MFRTLRHSTTLLSFVYGQNKSVAKSGRMFNFEFPNSCVVLT